MNNIIQNIQTIRHRMMNACHISARNPDEVKLLLATKTVEAAGIKIALQAGETLIGENKVQELRQKYDALKNEKVEVHFIGHLQTNKIKDVLKYTSCIQSVDRLTLAQKLDHRLQYESRSIDILVQINTSCEESKFGIEPEKALDLVKHISCYDTLKVKGLMTIGLFSAEQGKVRKCFRLLKQIQQKVIDLDLPGVEMQVLSMGMSNDLETAIEEGSTMVRVGTAIFGQRQHPDSYYWNESREVK